MAISRYWWMQWPQEFIPMLAEENEGGKGREY